MNLPVWHAVYGAERYLESWITGDRAGTDERKRRCTICKACPSRLRMRAKKRLFRSDWCGPPLRPIDGEAPTCGCLIAAKTDVGSEKCPQGKW